MVFFPGQGKVYSHLDSFFHLVLLLSLLIYTHMLYLIKVILYSYLILKKMNERITDS